MARAPSICGTIGCPHAAVYRGRCRRHAQEYERQQRLTVPTKATETWAERKRRAQAVREHVAKHGHVCPGWRTPPHHGRDLTADHIDETAYGGQPDGPLQVLCRRCNSRKEAAARAAYVQRIEHG